MKYILPVILLLVCCQYLDGSPLIDSVENISYQKFISEDSILGSKNVFIGERHPWFNITDQVLKDILLKALSTSDTVYLVLEIPPVTAKMIELYIKNSDKSILSQLLSIENTVDHKNKGWLNSKMNMFDIVFKKEIQNNRLLIKGIETESRYFESLQYVYQICNNKIQDKELQNRFNDMYINVKKDGPLTFIDYYKMISSIANYFHGDYSILSKEERQFIYLEFKAIEQEYQLDIKKLESQEYLRRREDFLYSNFINNISPNKSSKVVCLFGLYHVTRSLSTDRSWWNPFVFRLVESNFIYVDCVLAIVKDGKINQLVKENVLAPSLKWLSKTKMPASSVWSFKNKNRYYDYIVLSKNQEYILNTTHKK